MVRTVTVKENAVNRLLSCQSINLVDMAVGSWTLQRIKLQRNSAMSI